MPLPQAADAAGWDALCSDDAALAPGVAALCARHGLDGAAARRYDSGSLPVYAVGATHVLKLYPPPEADHAAVEARTLAAVHGQLPIATPQAVATDELDGWHALLMTQLPGRRLVDAWPQLTAGDRDRIADELGATLAALHAIDTGALHDITPRWQSFLPAQRDSAFERQRARRLDAQWLQRLPEFLHTWMPVVGPPRCLLHTEVMREHLMVRSDGTAARLCGLFDFEPAMLGEPEYEFASLGLFVACGDARFLRRTLRAYGYRPDQLDASLQCRLMAYAMLHRYSNLRWYLERLPAHGATTFEQLARRWFALRAQRRLPSTTMPMR